MNLSTYNLILRKNAGKNATLIPLPQSNSYQKIKSFSSNPNVQEMNIEDLFNNKVLLFEAEKEWQLSINLTLLNIKKTIDSSLSIKKYSKDQNKYLINDNFIDGEDKKIKSIAEKIFNDEKNCKKIIELGYNFVLDSLIYGNPIKDLYPYTQALNDKVTDCGGYSTLLASLLQSRNIPTRLVVGHLISGGRKNLAMARLGFKKLELNNLNMHAWLEALLPDSSWFPMDPSIEWRRKNNQTRRKGGFGNIPNDRIVTSFGRNIEINFENKKMKFPILQHVEEIKL